MSACGGRMNIYGATIINASDRTCQCMRGIFILKKLQYMKQKNKSSAEMAEDLF